MKRILATILFLGISILAFAKQKIELNVSVFPDSSIVYLNEEVIGITPLRKTVSLDFSKFIKYKLTIKRTGFYDTTFLIDESNYLQFEFKSGKVNILEFKLARKINKLKNPQELPIAFDKMIIELTNGQKVGEIIVGSSVKPYYWEESGINTGTVEFNNMAEVELSNFGYNTVRQGKLFSDEQNIAPKLLLGANLRSLNYKSVLNYYGNSTNSCEMEIEWQLFNRVKNKVVFKYTNRGVYTKINGESGVVIRESFREALIELLNNDSFANVVMNQDKNVLLDNSKNPNGISVDRLPENKFKSQAEMINTVVKSTVTIKSEDKFGSGFVITSNGYIITNQHVISAAKEIVVVFENGMSLPAEIVYENEAYDVALIKIVGSGYKPLRLGNSDGLIIGSDVFAVGTPKRLDLGQTVTKGIVSAKRKFDERDFIQTDASIHSGNSGGPLLNEKGEVVGINSMKFNGTEGLNLAIPINVAIEKLNIIFK